MNIRPIILLALPLGLLACASAPQPNATLDRARAAIQSAAADPNVSQFAPLDLEAAKKHLADAEQAAREHHEKEVDQQAYLASQTARLAQLRGETKADDAHVAQGRERRNQIELQARTQQAQNAQAAAQQAQAQNSRLQEEIQKMKATPTARGLLLTLGDVLFDTGRAELNPGAGSKLDQLAQFLNQHPDRRVQIDGFTDSVGSPAFNESLSERRADAVKAALVMRGVDPGRISTQGYGSAYPVASNSDSGGRQLNRRVEVVIGNGDNQPIAPRG
jgi:outer membrane protein OmpA-like peptidoglycan-associated protein